MSTSDRLCISCDTPVPDDAGFCPTCGEATPTVISGEDTIAPPEPSISADEAEYKYRLQQALGEDYELQNLVGRGGFGAVYKAWDRKLERELAIKALRHDVFATPALLHRFEREAKAVAKLRHPNILPVYTIGEGQGIAFMVMPFIQGESLRSMLDREGKLSVEEAVRITIGTAKALEAAHKLGFVHRDVKPENIMLETDERHVLLADFGIAKAVAGDSTAITGSGVIIGSPQYMSPEQARGEKDLDYRSDLYSLGAVAYEMLSGRKPFEAENLHELVYKHVTADPEPIATKDTTVPDAVSHAVMKCLAKEPSDRWQSASELVSSLESALGSETMHAGSPRRRARWAVAGPLMILAIGVVAIIVARTGGSDSSIPVRAVALLEEAQALSESGDQDSARALYCQAGEIYAPLNLPAGFCSTPTRDLRPEAVTLYTRGLLYADRGQNDRAAAMYCRALEIFPAYGDVEQALAQIARDSTMTAADVCADQ